MSPGVATARSGHWPGERGHVGPAGWALARFVGAGGTWFRAGSPDLLGGRGNRRIWEVHDEASQADEAGLGPEKDGGEPFVGALTGQHHRLAAVGERRASHRSLPCALGVLDAVPFGVGKRALGSRVEGVAIRVKAVVVRAGEPGIRCGDGPRPGNPRRRSTVMSAWVGNDDLLVSAAAERRTCARRRQ